MKLELASHERMLAAIKRQPVDHIPLGQVFHSTVLGTPADKQWRDQFERAQVMKDLGLDPVIDIWLPTPEPPPSVHVRKWTEADPDGPFSSPSTVFPPASGATSRCRYPISAASPARVRPPKR